MDTNLDLINEYIETLNENEKKALEIAKKNLNSSFDIEKSIGYLKWIEKKNVSNK